MTLLERLNVPLERGSNDGISPLHWAYAAHLADNVPHRHTYYEACLVGRYGAGTFRVGEREIRIETGDLFVARPGAIHQIQNTAQPEMELFWVAFDVKKNPTDHEIGALWRAFVGAETVVARDDGQIYALWHALRLLAQSGEKAGKSTQLSALCEAVLLAIAQAGAGEEAPRASPLLQDGHGTARIAARYLHDNLGRKISVEEIATHVYLSPRQLHRVFSEFAGVSVTAYLETARLDRARHQLHSTDRPLKEIAAALGYEDIHYFTRVFTRRNGVAPGEYRRLQGAIVRKIHKNGDLV